MQTYDEVFNWSSSKNILFTIYSFVFGGAILRFFEQYIFNDWDFLVSLVLIILFDTLFGVILSIKNKNFSAMYGISRIVIKLLYITLGVMLIGIISNIRIDGETSLLYEYVDAGLFSVLIGFESMSALKNLYNLNPPTIIKKPIEKIIHKMSKWLEYDDSISTEEVKDKG
jgi:hypothetical protein